MFGFLKHIFRIHFIFIVLAILVGVYHKQIQEELQKHFGPSEVNQQDSAASTKQLPLKDEKLSISLFTKEELAKFNGEDGQPIYLALLGSVYDVTKGIKHYGPGCSYNFFVGRDASVSFITGEFENYVEDKADDVLSLTPSELLSLDNWKKFYDKDYIYKGKLIGRFYDENGDKTPYHFKFLALVEQAQEAKDKAEQLREEFPDCNIEWSAELGTRVWCTTTSGNGKDRSWTGYPRKLYQIGKDDFRCACVQEKDWDTKVVMIKPYDNCDLRSKECFYRVD